MKNTFLPCLILILCFASAKAQAPTDDTQSWNDITFAAPLNKTTDFVVSASFRFGQDISTLVDRRIGVGFTYRAGKYLTLYPFYQNIDTKNFAGRSAGENRLNFAATVRYPAKKFTLSNRSLFERRLRFPSNSTRYRNRLQLDYPTKFHKIKFFVADEVFYDWSVKEWTRNRFSIGGGRDINKSLTFEVYYMRQNDGRGRPGDLHVIGTGIRLRP
ncbi:MAG TPA: DUF2490 domain-containing protein [Pyrinomonadaceae bacterium]|jgi:hypothetical protein|nr:DUF2490 domain-containing protein [Pyrinomonadaceae bacterium]